MPYTVTAAPGGLEFLKERFSRPPDDLNWVFFGTSGVHGTYRKANDIALLFDPEKQEEAMKIFGEWDGELPCDCNITFLIVMPRLVSMIYGNATLRSMEDVDFIRGLAAKTMEAVSGVMKENIAPS